MSDDTVKIGFDFEADPQAIGRIENALDNIAKSQERVSKKFAEGNISLKEADTKQKKLNTSKQELLSLERLINAEADRSNQKREEAIQQERALTEESKRGLRQQQDRFDTISQDVSLAGDFQSNLGAIRGLSSAAGLGGVSQALDITGESVALIEELPRLLAATAGLPDTLKASAASIQLLTSNMAASVASSFAAAGGISGMTASSVAFIASIGPFALVALGAAAAVATLIAAFKALESEENIVVQAGGAVLATFEALGSVANVLGEEIGEVVEATEALVEAEKLTTEAAEDRLGIIAKEQESLAELTAIREANNQETGDLTERSQELSAETAGLTQAMESGATAINDTRVQEQILADERSQAALEAGEDAAALVKLQQEISEANTEQLNDLVSDLEKRKAVLEAEKKTLLDAEEQTEATQARLAKLTDGIGDLSEQLDSATSSASRATAAENTLNEERAEAAKEAEKEAKKAAKDQLRAQEKAAKDVVRANEKQRSEIQKAAKKRADNLRKIDENLLKLQDDFKKKSFDAFRDGKRDELKETRSADKSRKDLLKSLSRQEEDLIASGDIFAIADLREQASDDLADLRTDFDFDAGERAIQRRNEANDRLREAREQRQKLREAGLAEFSDLKQKSGAISTQWRAMLTGLGNDLSGFARAVTGRAGNVASARSVASQNIGVNVSIDGAPIRAIAQQEISGVR